MGAPRRHADADDGPRSGFLHEAFTYSSEESFLAGTVEFVTGGLAAGEAVLVAMPPTKLAVLQHHLPAEAARLRLERMDHLGRNPAWMIPTWVDFLAAGGGRAVRGLAEPVWPGRSADEQAECDWLEALVNVVFAGRGRFVLRCAFDAVSLEPQVIAAASRTHPVIGPSGRLAPSEHYVPAPAVRLPQTALAPPPASAATLGFDRASLGAVRWHVERRALDAGLPVSRVSDIVLAVHEAGANSVAHGGGGGRLAIWTAGDRFVCDVTDGGIGMDPLAGHLRPPADQAGGRGLWLIHQLCDLVQLRVTSNGFNIRMHIGAPDRVLSAPAPAGPG